MERRGDVGLGPSDAASSSHSRGKWPGLQACLVELVLPQSLPRAAHGGTPQHRPSPGPPSQH